MLKVKLEKIRERYESIKELNKIPNKALQWVGDSGEKPLPSPTPELRRVCRAWHRTSGVEVPPSPTPGISGAEGQEKGKGVVVRRGLKEAQSESAGRRTETGYEVWYIRGEWARDHEALHPQEGCAL